MNIRFYGEPNGDLTPHSVTIDASKNFEVKHYPDQIHSDDGGSGVTKVWAEGIGYAFFKSDSFKVDIEEEDKAVDISKHKVVTFRDIDEVYNLRIIPNEWFEKNGITLSQMQELHDNSSPLMDEIRNMPQLDFGQVFYY